MSTLTILLSALVITLVGTLMGFKKTVWFISIGYTFSVVLIGFALLLADFSSFSWFNFAQTAILILWAFRLGFFLVQREKNDIYNAAVADQTEPAQQVAIGVKVAIWLSVSLLYVGMFSPAIFSLQSVVLSPLQLLVIFAGLGISLTGLLLEAVADRQKSAFKKEHPRKFVSGGLYSWVRCPNYLGEILVWTGNFIVGISFYNAWWQWALAAIGFVCIVLIMMGSTKRLETKQAERYGSNEAYQKYIQTVPVLFPWLPIFSLKNVKVYLE